MHEQHYYGNKRGARRLQQNTGGRPFRRYDKGRGRTRANGMKTCPYALITDVLPTSNDMDRRSTSGLEEMIQARCLATTHHMGTEEPLACQDLSHSTNDLVVGLCSYLINSIDPTRVGVIGFAGMRNGSRKQGFAMCGLLNSPVCLYHNSATRQGNCFAAFSNISNGPFELGTNPPGRIFRLHLRRQIQTQTTYQKRP